MDKVAAVLNAIHHRSNLLELHYSYNVYQFFIYLASLVELGWFRCFESDV